MPKLHANLFLKCMLISIQIVIRLSIHILPVQLVNKFFIKYFKKVEFLILDTENIRFVFAAVKDTILQLNLKEYNLV